MVRAFLLFILPYPFIASTKCNSRDDCKCVPVVVQRMRPTLEQVFKAASPGQDRDKVVKLDRRLMRKIQASLNRWPWRHSYFSLPTRKIVSIPMQTFSFDSLWMSVRDSFQLFEFVCHFRFQGSWNYWADGMLWFPRRRWFWKLTNHLNLDSNYYVLTTNRT